MSIGTVAGLIFGIGLFLLSIVMSTDKYIIFWSGSSVILVLGGTLANAFIAYQGVYVLKAIRDCFTIYGHAKVNSAILADEVRRVLGWTDIVRDKGIVGLDDHIKNDEPDEHLLAYGIDLVLKGYKPDAVRELLSNTIQSEFQRASIRAQVLDNMASNAPAFGMIGTLVGLVIMLDGMGTDPAALGAGLAVALLTTLYGVLFARLVFQPAGKKVRHREELFMTRSYIMAELFVMLAEQRKPIYIQDRIRSFLAPSLLNTVQGTPEAPTAQTPDAPTPSNDEGGA